MVAGFEGTATFRARRSRISPIQSRHCELFNAASDAEDSVRRMLESSWNTSKMGKVPADPESAAEEAYKAILQAAGGTKTADGDIEETGSMTGTFFIDLLLPAYDISQVVEGVALYDEVTAVEYCIALADCFKGKTEILVKDDNIVQTVTKVLNARKKMEEEQSVVSDGDVMFGNGGDGDVVFGDGNLVDDIEDALDDVDEGIDSDPDDDFRQKLLANWNDPDAPTEDGIDISSSKPSKPIQEIASATPTSYRLASLFGNAKIREGPDMATAVIQAVRENALAADEEDNIIILSARGKDEMVAVRGLVAKYGGQKKIIMVNCQFSPVPRELQTAETVYSVLPLAGKKTTNDDIDSVNEDPPPKIVVLRRYPKEWEIFVDVGIGYELAENVAMNLSNKRGLGMEFIARAVARHLDFVSRR